MCITHGVKYRQTCFPCSSFYRSSSGLEILHEDRVSSKEVRRHIIFALTLLLLGQWLLITYEEA